MVKGNSWIAEENSTSNDKFKVSSVMRIPNELRIIMNRFYISLTGKFIQIFKKTSKLNPGNPSPEEDSSGTCLQVGYAAPKRTKFLGLLV